MNALGSLLVDVGRVGIELAASGVRLRHRPATLPPDLAARLRLHKAGVLMLLRGEGLPDESDPDSEAGYVMGERLGVANELGMPTHPGAPAWLVAVGEGLNSSCPMTTDTVD